MSMRLVILAVLMAPGCAEPEECLPVAPVAAVQLLGDDQELLLSEIHTVTAEASTASCGSDLAYTWSWLAQPEGSVFTDAQFQGNATPGAATQVIQYGAPGVYELQVEIIDIHALTDVDSITFEIIDG